MLLRRPTEFLHIQYEHSEVIVLPYHKQILTKYIDQLKGKMYLNILVCFKGIKEIIPPTINYDVHVCLRCNCFLRKLFSHQIFSLQVFRDKIILSSIFWSFYRYVIKNSFALRSRNYFSLCLSSALIIELVFPDKTCLTKSEHYKFLFYWK